MDAIDAVWVLMCGFMVLDMQGGFLCLESGLASAKNSANVALKNVSDICTTVLCFWLVGFGLMFGHSSAGLIGTSLFMPAIDGIDFGIAPFMFFQMAFASTSITIVSGAISERASFPAYLAFSAIMAACIYPVVGHAAWGGALLDGQQGWLAALGFVDFAGASVVHSVGGWAALVYCVLLGARLGRFGRRSRRFEPSSLSMAALGVVFLWIGWTGFNAGSGLAHGEAVGPIVIRTMLGATAGGLTAIILSYAFWQHASAQIALNGVIAGLVAGTAGIHMFTGADSLIIGSVGALVMLAARIALHSARIDDVVDAIPVHLAPGILGTLGVAVLGDLAFLPAETRWAQFGIQLTGVAFVGAWTIAASAVSLWLLRHLLPLRVTSREEIEGLDSAEHRIGHAFGTLMREMKTHQKSGKFNLRAPVSHSGDFSTIAQRYHKVLDRVEIEIAARMDAVKNEREMRAVVEQSYAALKNAQQESARAARHDQLTGLGNRLLLDEITQTASDSDESKLLVIALDLDRFKSTNDRHGHDAGDAVLMAVASRLQAVMREGQDYAFRIGGDEFVLLVNWTDSITDPQDYCDTLRDDLTARVEYGVLQLDLGASIGYVLSSGTQSLRKLLRCADMALYQAKNIGRGASVAYSETIGSLYTAHVEEMELFKNAFPRKEFFPVFQPQVDAQSGALVGCEVLARWNHPHRGVLAPDQFLPLADEMDLLADLDRMILDHAIAASIVLASAGIDLDSISVNVSARRLASPDLLDELRARPQLPGNLTFEILETAHLDTLDADLSSTLDVIKLLGIRIEVDDFGTGHASLASLLALRPDALKIDQMFVHGIDSDEGRRELMRALLDIAARFGAKTIVEGVETAGQANVLRELGAGRLQGYHYSPPLELEPFLAWAMPRAAKGNGSAA